MTPFERAAWLKMEADQLLLDIQLEKLCQDIGPITPTGSYFLDLMIYPDIDLYLPPAKPLQMFHIASNLVQSHPIVKLNYQKGGQGPLKEGLYIKPVIAVGKWERPWKIDIWAISQDFIDRQTKELLSLKGRMSPEQRELILNYKFSILTEEHRTPHFSGIHIYRAVIDHGMVDYAEITEYLRSNAIQI